MGYMLSQEELEKIRDKLIGKYLVFKNNYDEYRYIGRIERIEIGRFGAASIFVLIYYGSLNKECRIIMHDGIADEILNDKRVSQFIFDAESEAELFMEMKKN